MKCGHCGQSINSYADYGQPGECRTCFNNRHARYRLKRYLQDCHEWEVIKGGYKPYNIIMRGRVS